MTNETLITNPNLQYMNSGSVYSPQAQQSTTAANSVSPTTNLNFNPVPTTNTKCSKLKIKIIFDDQINVAGVPLTGRLELKCTSGKMQIGDISLNLSGFEGTLYFMQK